MDFPTALLAVADEKDPASAVKLRSKSPQDHPRLWHARAVAIAHRYERKTGNKIEDVGTFDWSTILQWLKDNWKTILQVVLALISIFLAEPETASSSLPVVPAQLMPCARSEATARAYLDDVGHGRAVMKLPEDITDEDSCQRGPTGEPLVCVTPFVPFNTMAEWVAIGERLKKEK